jgi:hypothetical protein
MSPAQSSCRSRGGRLHRCLSSGPAGTPTPACLLSSIAARLTPPRKHWQGSHHTLQPARRYFAAAGTLNKAYWIGVNRTTSPNLYAFCDGGYVPQLVSEEPYGHWSWFHFKAKANADNACARASPDVSFEYFFGNTSLAADMGNYSYYVVTGSSRKYGWTGINCVSQLPYMCELPAARFACPPPPSPDEPAWPPVSPPLAPPWDGVVPQCSPSFNSTFFCHEGSCYGYYGPRVFPKAQEACRNMQAELVRYDTFQEQVSGQRCSGRRSRHPLEGRRQRGCICC